MCPAPSLDGQARFVLSLRGDFLIEYVFCSFLVELCMEQSHCHIGDRKGTCKEQQRPRAMKKRPAACRSHLRFRCGHHCRVLPFSPAGLLEATQCSLRARTLRLNGPKGGDTCVSPPVQSIYSRPYEIQTIYPLVDLRTESHEACHEKAHAEQ